MAKKKNSEFFASLLYIIVGILLVIFRSQTLGWAMTIAGLVFVVSGALDLIKKNYTGGAPSSLAAHLPNTRRFASCPTFSICIRSTTSIPAESSLRPSWVPIPT